MPKLLSKNNLKTKNIAATLAKKILNAKSEKWAKIIALSGNLGTGKTTFTQGFIRALGSKEKITSPTFLIFKIYRLKNIKYKKIFHFDFYRIGSIYEINALGFQEIISNSENIIIIEWADKIFTKHKPASRGKKFLPKNTIWINFNYGMDENERIIEISKKIS